MSDPVSDARRAMLKKLNRRRKIKFSVRRVRTKCEICSMTFKSRGIKEKHMSIHSDVKEFSCEICSKQFRRNDQLKMHVPTHFKGYGLTKQDFKSMPLNALCLQYKPIVKTKIFECPTCSKTFKSKQQLREHLPVHSNARPYCCQICSKAFKRADYMRLHFSLCHPDFAQNYRDYMFVDETNVEHIEGKNYQCDICSKYFGCKDSIKLHLFSHFDVKPYECLICSKAFRSRPQLRKHLRKHIERKDDTPEDAPLTQLTICKQEVDIDEQGLIKVFDIKPSKVVLKRIAI